MQLNFVFPARYCPEKGQQIDIRAHADVFNKEQRCYEVKRSLPNDVLGEVTDIQPHYDPDFVIVTISITSEL